VSEEREIRAARNQSMFRAINDKIETLTETFASVVETYTIVCECADVECLETVEIEPSQYAQIRESPRCFAVLPGHVYPEVERVVAEFDHYVVVEKMDTAGEAAEAFQVDGRTGVGERAAGG
jgi:hypothetical protein